MKNKKVHTFEGEFIIRNHMWVLLYCQNDLNLILVQNAIVMSHQLIFSLEIKWTTPNYLIRNNNLSCCWGERVYKISSLWMWQQHSIKNEPQNKLKRVKKWRKETPKIEFLSYRNFLLFKANECDEPSRKKMSSSKFLI